MSFLKRHQLPTYLALTFAITWGAIGLYLASLGFEFAKVGTAVVVLVVRPRWARAASTASGTA